VARGENEETRNPKSEIRRKSEVRNPKAEGDGPSAGEDPAALAAAASSPVGDDSSSTTKSPSRFTNHVSRITSSPPALPDLILIDGGKGQLGAACAELEKLGLSHIPTIGLAKEFEEIYRPGEKEPLRLSHESGALKLLQRVRDESHRFANTYNAQLRLRKISESLLDEFRAEEGSVAEEVRLGSAPSAGQRRATRGSAGFRGQGGGGIESVPGGAAISWTR
jgi:hypothetical protein